MPLSLVRSPGSRLPSLTAASSQPRVRGSTPGTGGPAQPTPTPRTHQHFTACSGVHHTADRRMGCGLVRGKSRSCASQMVEASEDYVSFLGYSLTGLQDSGLRSARQRLWSRLPFLGPTSTRFSGRGPRKLEESFLP